jgi:hypothetical protein
VEIETQYQLAEEDYKNQVDDLKRKLTNSGEVSQK